MASRKQETDFIGGMVTGSALSREAAARGESAKVFDWMKAARLIVERKPTKASAGLVEDWNNTGGVIFKDGHPVPAFETYTYLKSSWATPILDLDGEEIDCYVYEGNTNYGAGTYWPPDARAVLVGMEVLD